MRKKEVYYHIAGWSIYIVYIIIGYLFHFSGGKSLLFTLSLTFLEMMEFYICYLWVYPKFLKKNKILPLLAGILLAIFCFIMARYLLEEVVFSYFFHIHNYIGHPSLLYYCFDNLYFGSSSIFLSAAVYSIFSALHKEQENKSLREEKVQAELAFLKTQVNPHFLYNTLNYIYSLAYPVSEELGDAIIKLSKMMRYMLTETADGTVELEKELEYIQNYISIYQLRFNDSFFVDFNSKGNIDGKRIAPLLLIPFVENAFKHGIVNNPSNPIKIHLEIEGNQMQFKVSNQINQQQKDHTTGIGLPNIRKRLALIFPQKHELKIIEEGEMYNIILNIEL